jgi:hypothetical protein
MKKLFASDDDVRLPMHLIFLSGVKYIKIFNKHQEYVRGSDKFGLISYRTLQNQDAIINRGRKTTL